MTHAIQQMAEEARADLELISRIELDARDSYYHRCLEELGCLTTRFRGSGFKTALAAALLAYAYRDQDPAVALVVAANELDSDTDTIATMAGAVLGAVSSDAPEWPIQDRAYIVNEAVRLSAIARGVSRESFTYPDLGHWNPPTKQTASIGLHNGKLAIAGLGSLEPLGQEYRAGDAVWQWLILPFGQSLLAKRKANLKDRIDSSQLPGPSQDPLPAGVNVNRRKTMTQPSLPLNHSAAQHDVQPSNSPMATREGIDDWTDLVIRSNFDHYELGRLLNRCIDATNSVEAAVAFSAIIAKAKLARRKRR
ncbi:ADP-ribosylglycohydrolase family protein [Bradyrhizobium sp. NBAIM08]|uniref:ADP-ribosylglycohydrolase family protein n=1 Tax=Bradyrhizobium sp. NBAIM08 TaxID=2793815 RepID=UPI001CD2DF8D|nr:ADP-ribosylglycohydrolase family protein [Bradyrhizobium sp. NBAIM08]MCA1478925.1 hypothetical protein [Bradyrhizobium sp. NBAIM08]